MTIYASSPDLGLIITIIVLVVAAVAGIAVLLWFLVFSRMRVQKQGRNIISRFEQKHALLFGDVLAYTRRLETISTMNLVYVEDFTVWNNRFKSIRDSIDATAQATANSIKDLLSERRYKELKEYLSTAKGTIDNYSNQVEELYASLKEKFRTEENANALALSSKESFRKVKQDYYTKQVDISILSSSFDTLFKKINDLMVQADSDIENARYEDAETIYKSKITPVVNTVGAVLKYLPSICLQITNTMPDKIASLSAKYEELIQNGYPLNHIMVRGTISNLKEELNKITEQVKTLNIKGVEEHFDDMRKRIASYEESFDKEIEARRIFENENIVSSTTGNNVTNAYIDLVHAVPKIKTIYLLDEEDENKLVEIKELVDKSQASKRTLDTYLHSGTKQPYTVLVDRMETLQKQTKEAKEAIDKFTAYLQSLKSNSERAAKGVQAFHNQIRDAETELRAMNLSVLNSRYTPLIDESYQLIDDLFVLLRTAPIDVKKVKSSHDELIEKANALISNLQSDKEQMRLAEESIVHANRYRANDQTVNDALAQAETFFNNGEFQEATNIAHRIIQANSVTYTTRRK